VSVVVLLDADFASLDPERQLLGDAGHELAFDEDSPSPHDVEAMLMTWRPVDDAELSRWPRLRVIGRFGVGVDMIDLEGAREREVAVVNSGEYSTEEVTTHALALTLALLRQVVGGDRATRRGGWTEATDASRMARVSDLIVGVVGLGRIGRRVGHTWSAGFGCEVIGHDPHATLGGGEPIRQVERLEDLLAVADVVTLHSPLTAESRHLIGAEQLATMKRTAVLVNVARGGLVDEQALVEALGGGEIGGAGLDVFEDEPLEARAVITRLDNVVLSPHVGYLSPKALEQARRQTVEDLIGVLAGRDPVHTLGV
jgi:D-3-phosphoglycerate dehydrogenase / 2-oxoglutarate reductase